MGGSRFRAREASLLQAETLRKLELELFEAWGGDTAFSRLWGSSWSCDDCRVRLNPAVGETGRVVIDNSIPSTWRALVCSDSREV